LLSFLNCTFSARIKLTPFVVANSLFLSRVGIYLVSGPRPVAAAGIEI